RLDGFEPEGGVDEAEVAEPLREVAEELERLRVDLFGEEPERAGMREERVERGARRRRLTGQRVGLDEPERRQQERALRPADAVVAVVAVEQRPRPGGELALDG